LRPRPAPERAQEHGPPNSAPSRTALPPIGRLERERERRADAVEDRAPAERRSARAAARSGTRARTAGSARRRWCGNGAQPPSGKAQERKTGGRNAAAAIARPSSACARSLARRSRRPRPPSRGTGPPPGCRAGRDREQEPPASRWRRWRARARRARTRRRSRTGAGLVNRRVGGGGAEPDRAPAARWSPNHRGRAGEQGAEAMARQPAPRRRQEVGQGRRDNAVGGRVMAAVPLAVPDREALLAEQVRSGRCARRGRRSAAARSGRPIVKIAGDGDRRDLPRVDAPVPGRVRAPPREPWRSRRRLLRADAGEEGGAETADGASRSTRGQASRERRAAVKVLVRPATAPDAGPGRA
jgi:hypothetical protein